MITIGVTGIQPADLWRENATLALAQKAKKPAHLLHQAVTEQHSSQRISSRRPFAQRAKALLERVGGTMSKRSALAHSWDERWNEEDTRLHRFLPGPSSCPPGTDLTRRSWVALNRLRSGVRRFKAQMHQWGLAPSGDCDCVAPQTAYHLISDCPLHRALYVEKGLLNLDVDTRDWLEGVPC